LFPLKKKTELCLRPIILYYVNIAFNGENYTVSLKEKPLYGFRIKRKPKVCLFVLRQKEIRIGAFLWSPRVSEERYGSGGNVGEMKPSVNTRNGIDGGSARGGDKKRSGGVSIIQWQIIWIFMFLMGYELAALVCHIYKSIAFFR